MGICCSISRQALIFSLRQTQQSGSPAARPVVSAPQTEHFSTFFSRSGEMDLLRLFQHVGWNHRLGFWLDLTFHETPDSAFTMTESDRSDNLTLRVPVRTTPLPGSVITTATSREDPQRGHFCPAATRACLPLRSISAGTVCVHIGQWAKP